MNDMFQNLMRDATRLTQSGLLTEATEAIQRGLARVAAPGPARMQTPAQAAAPEQRASWAASSSASALSPLILDGYVFEVKPPSPATATAASAVAQPPVAGSTAADLHARLRPAPSPDPRNMPAPEADGVSDDPGEFIDGSHTHAAQTRSYKLYVPPASAGQPLPLVVMLHGCTQDPDDFAAGTGMNERAREQGFFVLYPAQSQDANPQRCWNWFKHNHQERGSGEPALIASMTQAVISEHGIDAQRVYIAGLSAGGAMAAIVASTYPEMFAAVGVHSGLPRGAASDVAGAFAVMSSGGAHGAGPALQAKTRRTGSLRPTADRPHRPVPTIVFHGDQDRTVHPRNGEQVIAAMLSGVTTNGSQPSKPDRSASPQVEQGVSTRGRRYTRTTHRSDQGHAVAEHWLVHGAGHAWSGGEAQGSYTDATGPDATNEMLRFFFEQRPGSEIR